jgi:hypothetical protein
MAVANGASEQIDTQKHAPTISSSYHSPQFWLLSRHTQRNGYGSFGTLYKVPRAEKKEHEVYTTLLLILYILDTVEASILLAMGSAYLNLHQLRYLISSDNYMEGRATLGCVLRALLRTVAGEHLYGLGLG